MVLENDSDVMVTFVLRCWNMTDVKVTFVLRCWNMTLTSR